MNLKGRLRNIYKHRLPLIPWGWEKREDTSYPDAAKDKPYAAGLFAQQSKGIFGWERKFFKTRIGLVLYCYFVAPYPYQYTIHDYLWTTIMNKLMFIWYEIIRYYWFRLTQPAAFKWLEIKNFTYDGFGVTTKKEVAPYKVQFLTWKYNPIDPGMVMCNCSDGKIRSIPTFVFLNKELKFPGEIKLKERNLGFFHLGSPSSSD